MENKAMSQNRSINSTRAIPLSHVFKNTSLAMLASDKELPIKVIHENTSCFTLTKITPDNEAHLVPRKGSIDGDKTIRVNVNSRGDWQLGWGVDE